MSGRSAPRVSVIVPVRNRRDLLARLLASLDRQSCSDFEAIVVDDGSDDGAAELAEATAVGGRPVTVVRTGGVGAVAARTAGVAAARGEVLAFTDSDCEADPGWVAAIVGAVDGGADMVVGCTRPARPMKPLERSLWAGEENLFPTCNVAYRRSVFDAVGGFDRGAAEWLGFRHDRRARGDGFGEDTLLGWRVRRAGFAHRYVPEALVLHHVFTPELVETISRTWRVAAFPELLRAVPELRSTLVRRGVLLGPRNRVPLYATAGATLTGRRLLVVAALAWWSGTRLWEIRGHPTSKAAKLAAVPGEMAVDVVTAVALAVGSARSRTLLL